MLFEHGFTRCPVESAHDAHEARHRVFVVAARIGRERRPDLLEERLAARHREQRELEQDQRVHDLGVVEGELGADCRTAGMAGDVGARDSEVVEECRGVRSVIRDGHRGWGMRAADPTSLVVADELVAVGQRRLRQQWEEAVGEDGADEQHGFARSDHLVFELDAVDVCDFHGSSFPDWLVASGPPGPYWSCVSKTVTAVTPTVTFD
jgi:hypothetical protein